MPRDEATLDRYNQYPKVTEIFPVNSVGIVTSRDSFVIDSNKDALKRRIMMFRNTAMPDDLIRQSFGLKDKGNWKLKEAREKVIRDEEWENTITKILYRPFDTQWIFYHDEAIERSRKEVMRHMMQENLGLVSARSNKSSKMDHFFCSAAIMETKCGESTTQSCLFPLYLYPDTDKKDLFSATEVKHKAPNINSALFAALSTAYGKKPTPEEIFYYIYAVLYSNTYRKKYAEFLKTDFPRVPFTKSYKLFIEMGRYGKELVELHLLKSPDLDPPIARFQGKGDNRVEKPRYIEGEQRIYINATQYFEGIEKEVWEYQIGGYQVLDKWLKDRKKRVLSLEDIQHYCQVATALKKTIEVQGKIDDIYNKIEEETIPPK